VKHFAGTKHPIYLPVFFLHTSLKGAMLRQRKCGGEIFFVSTMSQQQWVLSCTLGLFLAQRVKYLIFKLKKAKKRACGKNSKPSRPHS